jgi:hypothetical protein
VPLVRLTSEGSRPNCLSSFDNMQYVDGEASCEDERSSDDEDSSVEDEATKALKDFINDNDEEEEARSTLPQSQATADEAVLHNQTATQKSSQRESDSHNDKDEEERLIEEEMENIKKQLYNDPDCSNNIGRCLRVVRMKDVQVKSFFSKCAMLLCISS